MAFEVESMKAAAVARAPRASSRRWRAAAAVLILWPLAAWSAALLLVARAETGRADALVVLSGSAAYAERAAAAARLYREGRAPLVLLTDDGVLGGWSEAEGRNPRFVELAAAELRRGGVPAEAVQVLEARPTNTHDEAEAVRAYAEGRGLRSLVVVTSAYHSRRALWTWRRVFQGSGVELGLEPAPAGQRTPAAWSWWLSAEGWREVAGEHVKLVYYAARY